MGVAERCVPVLALRPRWRLIAFAFATTLAFACAATAFAPRQFVATGGVLLPSGMLKVEHTAADPRTAAAVVAAFIEQHRNPLLVDPPLVVAVRPNLGRNLALGAIAMSILGFLLLWRRRRPPVRCENQLIEALGAPLLAARPLAAQDLSRQLATHWFRQGRAVLAVVSPENGDGRTRVAAELARAFARMGEPTLLIDADLRSPGLHRAFGLRNRAGLADFLEERPVRLAHCAENLSVLVAGRSRADPLELLSRSRLRHLLAAAAKRYRVVLVDTPAAARGPDLQLFAAFGGGALVVAKKGMDAPALERLRDLLDQARARVVGTVLSPAALSSD
jgi:capsular exopolysaccharide synthesis family protein